MSAPLFQFKGLKKAFPGILALDDVEFELRSGEIHAVVGKNGAGKSTLISIISGILVPDAGTLFLDGEPLPIDRLDLLKVATVFQESTTFPNLTIAENIFAGNEPCSSLHRVDRAAENRRAKEHLLQFGLDVDPRAVISELSPAEQKVVEIIRCFEKECRILILDEPTAALSLTETDRLFELLAQAKRSGMAIIYISHRLEEIFQIADRVTVLRDGRVTLASPISSLDLPRLIAEIVGREAEAVAEVVATRGAEGDQFTERPIRFEARRLSHAGGRFKDVSMIVRQGEIVGLGGLVGAGKTEFGKAIFGAERLAAGELLLDGNVVTTPTPGAAIEMGIVYVTEDRKHEGLFVDMTIADNLCAPLLGRFADRWQMLRRGPMIRAAEKAAQDVRVKATGTDQIVATLSGGNQQKVLLGRWLQLGPKLLIVDEPTVGVDVSAREEIYRLLRARAEAGTAIIFISSELKELIQNTDRIVAMHEGHFTGSFLSHSVGEPELMVAIAGGGDSH